MRSVLPFLGMAIPAQIAVTVLFVIINNLPPIPWEIVRVLWYFYLPVSAFFIALIYGACRLRRGGGVIAAVLLLWPLPFLSFRFGLPFSNVFSFVPALLTAIPLALIGEIRGRTLNKRQKKSAPPKT
ncbi:MAG: hypothetical protein ACI4PP_07030 [Clostridia bacterium]